MAKNYLSVVYDKDFHPYSDYPKKLSAFLFQVFEQKKGMKMLKPGSGRGKFLNNFKDLGLDLVSVNIAPEDVNFNNALDAKLCDIEKETLPFDDNTFGIIFSKSFIEHLYYPEKYLEEAYRVLKPNGLLITLVPVRIKNKFFSWSREFMLLGTGKKIS